jgi:cyanate permease
MSNSLQPMGAMLAALGQYVNGHIHSMEMSYLLFFLLVFRLVFSAGL